MATRTVTGTILMPDGSKYQDAVVSFFLLRDLTTGAAIYPNNSSDAALDNIYGTFSIDLGVPDTGTTIYRAVLPNGKHYDFSMMVGPSTDLQTLIDIPSAPQDPDRLQILLDAHKVSLDPHDTNIRNVVSYGADPTGYDDSSASIQQILDENPTGGVTVFFPPGGTYTLRSDVIKLAKDYANPVVLSGYGATVKLSTAAPRFTDFNKIANYDTFQNIVIEGLTVDVDTVGGRGHVVIGTYTSAYNGLKINLSNITVRDVTTVNVPVDHTTGDHRLNVYLVAANDAVSAECLIENINIQNCDFKGGNQGVVVAGVGSGCKVRLENINLDNVKHSLLTPQPTGFSSVNFHICEHGYGGKVSLRNLKGYYSGDVGIEVDNMDIIDIDDCYMEDAYNICFLIRNQDTPMTYARQTISLHNCNTASILSLGQGFRVITTTHPMGDIYYDNCHSYIDGVGNSTWGFNTETNGSIVRSYHLLNCSVNIENYDYAGTGLLGYGSYLQFLTNETDLVIKNYKFSISGTNTGTITRIAAMDISGLVNLDIDGIKTSDALINIGTDVFRGLLIGRLASTMRGVIKGVNILSYLDTAPRGIYIYGKTTLAIADRITIRDCDFSVMSAGLAVAFGTSGGSNVASVFRYNNALIVNPPPAATITVTASVFTYQNLDGYAERVTVLAGTVSKIEFSCDAGGNYFDTGVVAGMFYLDHTDCLKVTYSSAPTMKKYPVK
jgi:hypothetical protein